ncbi:MAG: 2,3-dimethylmalate dehydratase small subunit [Desulfovibrio sp.]
MKIIDKAVVYNHDDISTDQIFPGPYAAALDLTNPEMLASIALIGADPTLRERFKTVGGILVVGNNFGCGSSREYAVMVLQAAGVKAVIVKSAARIWYRNAVNLALPVIFCPSLPDAVKEGAGLEIDLETGKITVQATGTVHQGEAPSEFVLGMWKLGGLKPLMRQRIAEKCAEIGACHTAVKA